MTEDTPLSTPILAGVIRTVSKTVHGLDPNVSYSVSVTAYNSAGIRGDTSTPQVVSRKYQLRVGFGVIGNCKTNIVVDQTCSRNLSILSIRLNSLRTALVIPGRRGYAISSRTSTIQLRLSGVGDCAEWRMLVGGIALRLP